MPEKSLLVAQNLRKSFGKTEALRGIDARLASGEVVAIMGPSGSGKSTLLHCLAGIIRPDHGTVHFQGKKINILSETQQSHLRRSSFGFVFQFGQLLPELTALDNVSVPLLLLGRGRKEAEAIGREWLQTFGLGNVCGKLPSELSGGQAQRVAVARAMATSPQILFADEPTGSLDSLTAEQVMQSMLAAAREHGTTVIIVTHDPRIAAYADRELIVRDGVISNQERAHHA